MTLDRCTSIAAAALALALMGAAPAPAQQAVVPVAPEGAITPTGPWGLAAIDRSSHTLYVAGMRGIDPKTNKLVTGNEARIRQAFQNMKFIAESQGAALQDCVRLVVYTTDMFRFRPIANQVQQELWGNGPYPPRTIVEVHRLNDDDILEVEGTFHVP